MVVYVKKEKARGGKCILERGATRWFFLWQGISSSSSSSFSASTILWGYACLSCQFKKIWPLFFQVPLSLQHIPLYQPITDSVKKIVAKEGWEIEEPFLLLLHDNISHVCTYFHQPLHKKMYKFMYVLDHFTLPSLLSIINR